MVKCQFTFKVASIGDNLCTVNFTPNSEQKTILITSKWQKGEKASKAGQSHFNTGFIGNGYTKWGVYVRIFVQLATLLCWRQWFRHLLMAMRWCLHKSWAMVAKLNIMQNLCILQSTGYFALLTTSKQWDMMATSRATTLKACLVHTYISHWYVQFLTRILLQLPRLLSGLTTEWWQWEKSFCTAISVIHCDPFASMWYGWLWSHEVYW